jgi:hypothetical protein
MTTNLLFVDNQSKRYELFGIKVLFNPFEIHFDILYSNHVILLYIWILHICRIPMIYYLQFLDLQKIFNVFYKVQHI